MADEDLAIAPAALETPASEPTATPEPVTPVDEPTRILDPGEDVPELDAGADLPDPEDEFVEVEWDDGKKYTIPKALETGILKNKDYTTKTQAAAALQKALEAREAGIEERLKATEEELDARADLRKVSKTLEEYSKLTPEDWAAHQAADPTTTENHWRNFQLLEKQKAELEGKITTAQAARTGAAEQSLATRIQETVAHAQKAIPGWKPDTIPKLVEFAATEMKIPEDTIKQVWSPTFIDVLYRAQIGDQLLKKQATAPKLPPPPGQPLKTVNGNSTPAARGDLGSMDMEAYVAARKSGVGGKALR